MAGIGFALRKLLVRHEISSILAGFVLSAVVAAGPWILTSIGLLIVGFFGVSAFPDLGLYLRFRSLVTFLFALSLILISPIQIPLTRFLADQFYSRNYAIVRSLFVTSTLLGALLCLPVGITGLFFLRLSLPETLAVLELFIVLSALWVTMSFVSTLRDYNSVALAFLLGNGLSIPGVILGAKYGGVTGALLGYTAGQGVILTVLAARIFIEFPGRVSWEAGLVGFIRKRWDLAVLGGLMSAGIWIDKILYWYGPGSEHVVGFIRMNRNYDIGMFFALLAIVPTLALFVAYFETGFFDQYRFYFSVIHCGFPYREIERAKDRMTSFLRRSLAFVIKIQGSIALLVLLNAHHILSFFHADLLSLPVFRIGTLGAILQVIFVLETTLLLYLNRGEIVLKLSVILLVLNTLLTLSFMHLGFRFEGMGYFISCLVASVVGYVELNRAFGEFEYTVFMRQPIVPDQG
jgi:uncharacterized membrane protein